MIQVQKTLYFQVFFYKLSMHLFNTISIFLPQKVDNDLIASKVTLCPHLVDEMRQFNLNQHGIMTQDCTNLVSNNIFLRFKLH